MLENTLGIHVAASLNQQGTLWPVDIICVAPNQVPFAYSEPHPLFQ